MNATRRGFFGFLGAAPLGIKSVVEDAVGSVRVRAPHAEKASMVSFGEAVGQPPWTLGVDPITRTIAPWRRAEMRRDAGAVHALDPDIAAMVSLSMVERVRRQRERQFARVENDTWLTAWIWGERDKAGRN